MEKKIEDFQLFSNYRLKVIPVVGNECLIQKKHIFLGTSKSLIAKDIPSEVKVVSDFPITPMWGWGNYEVSKPIYIGEQATSKSEADDSTKLNYIRYNGYPYYHVTSFQLFVDKFFSGELDLQGWEIFNHDNVMTRAVDFFDASASADFWDVVVNQATQLLTSDLSVGNLISPWTGDLISRVASGITDIYRWDSPSERAFWAIQNGYYASGGPPTASVTPMALVVRSPGTVESTGYIALGDYYFPIMLYRRC